MIDVLRGSSVSGVVRVGFAQDFTANVLPLVIERFSSLYPLVKLQGHSRPRPGAHPVTELRRSRPGTHSWRFPKQDRRIYSANCPCTGSQAPNLKSERTSPFPLALFNPPCGCQTRGLDSLQDAGRPWRAAMTSPSLPGLWAAVSAGLGLTARTLIGNTCRCTDYRSGIAAAGRHACCPTPQAESPYTERDAVCRGHGGIRL